MTLRAFAKWAYNVAVTFVVIPGVKRGSASRKETAEAPGFACQSQFDRPVAGATGLNVHCDY